MSTKTRFRALALFALLGVALALGACSSGPTQADMDALQKQLDAKNQQNATLQQQLQTAQAQAAASDVILGAQKKDAAPAQPPASAQPPAAGGPSGAPPQVPESYKAAQAMTFYVDTVTSGPGESPYHVDANLACTQTSAFKRGMRIVWRFTASDGATGKRLSPDDVDSAVVVLPTGQNIKAGFEPAGAPNLPESWFWHATFDVPMDYPLGTIDYTIQVKTKDGKTGTFKQLPVPPAQLQIVG
jgi:hypothetical protein